MSRSNVSSKFLYFVGIVFGENTGKVITMVNGWQYPRWDFFMCGRNVQFFLHKNII